MLWKAQKTALDRFLSYFGNEREKNTLQSFQRENTPKSTAQHNKLRNQQRKQR